VASLVFLSVFPLSLSLSSLSLSLSLSLSHTHTHTHTHKHTLSLPHSPVSSGPHSPRSRARAPWPLPQCRCAGSGYGSPSRSRIPRTLRGRPPSPDHPCCQPQVGHHWHAQLRMTAGERLGGLWGLRQRPMRGHWRRAGTACMLAGAASSTGGPARSSCWSTRPSTL
jgi:hypothetical protein